MRKFQQIKFLTFTILLPYGSLNNIVLCCLFSTFIKMELHCMYSFVSHFFCSVLCIQFICVAADSCDSFICIIIFHCIGEGNGTPLQCSCLENPMDGGSWWATVHGVAKSWTRLSDFTFIFTFLHWRRKWQPTPAFLPGESRGRGSLVGCHLWGCTESNTTEVTYEQQHSIV